MEYTRRMSDGDFPPTAGQIIHAAKALCLQRHPTHYRDDQGNIRNPNWYRSIVQGKRPQRLQLAAVN